MRKLSFLTTTAIFFVVASPAIAQDLSQTSVDEDAAASEIIVTALRGNASQQDTPATVTVLTEQTLENTGARVAADVVKLTAGVNIVTGTVEPGDTQVSIRGINGARDAENNVALVVDGILKTNTAALNQDQGAVTQIEVLKGPQGAYYGRSASAGAVVVTTKKPGDIIEGKAKISAGSNNTYSAALLMSGPLTENLGFVLSGDYSRTDGFYRNTFLPSALNKSTFPGNSTDATSVDDYERWGINARLVYSPSINTEIDMKFRYALMNSAAISFNAAFQLPDLAVALDAPDYNINVNDHKFVFTSNIDPSSRQETIESSIKLTQSLNDSLQLVSYVAFSKIDGRFYADGTSGTFGFFDNESTCIASGQALRGFPVAAPFGVDPGNPAVFLNPYSPTSCDGIQTREQNQKDISAEVRLIGELDRLNWQVGGYYIHIKRRTCVSLLLDTGQGGVRQCYTTDPRFPTEGLGDDTATTNSYALFGSADYELMDDLTLALAMRYDIEKRSNVNNVPVDARTRWVGNVLTGFPNGTATTPANYFLNPGLDPAYNPSGVLAPRRATFQHFQPKISISYKPVRNLTVYANWGVGFKTGGFNASGTQAIIDNFFNATINSGISISDTYKKEYSSAFEAGVKGSLLDRRLNYEFALYNTDVNNMQFFEFFVGPFGLLRVVSGMDKVRLRGLEGSINAKILDEWSLFGAANYTDSRIRKNSARPYTVGNKAPYTSEYTVNIGSEVDAPITNALNLFVRADYRITGPTWFHTVQDNDVPTIFGLTGNYKNSRRDAFGILNLRAGLKGDNWSLLAYANNLLNKQSLSEVTPAPEFGGDFLSPGEGRAFGVEAIYRF